MKTKIAFFFSFSFIFELLLFAFTILLAMGTALSWLEKFSWQSVNANNSGYSAWQFLLMFAIATIILFLLLKYFKRPWLIRGLFYLAIIQGLFYFSLVFFDWPAMIYPLLFLLFAWYLYRNIFMHNVVIVLSLAAIAAIFGLNFWPSSLVIVLLCLALYDYWAVYSTKHMVAMFQSLAQSKVHFSLIIPHDFKSLFKKIKSVEINQEFMFLGTGDLAIPAIFVVSCLKLSHLAAICSALGALAGFIFLTYLFISQKNRQPMPGLPPLVLGALLGFLIYFIL